MERFAPVPDSLLARAAAEAGAQVGGEAGAQGEGLGGSRWGFDG